MVHGRLCDPQSAREDGNHGDITLASSPSVTSYQCHPLAEQKQMSNDKGKVYMPISWHHDKAERGDFVSRHMNVNMDRRVGAETKNK